MHILQAAETTETDEFLRDFLERVSKEGSQGEREKELDIEEILSEFQELRERRRLSVAVR
jgi:hypothetical protein